MKIALSLEPEMKNSDPNQPKALDRIYYPPYLVPKTVGGITLKLLGYPRHLFKIQHNCIVFQCLKIALSWGAEMKNSDPNHPKALYRVYYPPSVVPKMIRVITPKLLGYP